MIGRCLSRWLVVLLALLLTPGGNGRVENTDSATNVAPTLSRPLPPINTQPPVDFVPVLLYHHLEPDATGTNGAIIKAGDFADQMDWLKQHDYHTVSTADLALWLDGKGQLPDKPVLVTFDDGYESNYTYAYPVLKRNGQQATIFVIGATVGAVKTYPSASWDQLAVMQRAGVADIQAHTFNGHRMIGKDPALVSWTAQEIVSDLHTLDREFTTHGLPAPTALAYPFGSFDEETVSAARQKGVSLAFTVARGVVRRSDNHLTLPRLVIYPGTSMCRFEQLLTDNHHQCVPARSTP